jgi:sialic acid synthase SpsE
MTRVLIIAEIGVNHNGDMALAKEMIAAAAGCNVDVIKFQTAIPELVQIDNAPKAKYQTKFTGDETSAMEMTRSFHFKHEAFLEIKKEVEKYNCEFLSTAFDMQSLQFLHSLQPTRYKIPSGEITNLPYLKMIGSYGKEVILSSGVSTPNGVLQAFEVLTSCGLRKDQITVLQCTTSYPTPLEDANVRAMLTLQQLTGGKMGYSDHTVGNTAALVAVALGAVVIEKHFTTDQSLPGPDQHASMTPNDFADLVRQIRDVEVAIGNGEKTVRPSEMENQAIARRGVYASRDLEAGEVLIAADLVMLRPQTLVSPMEIDAIVGKRLRAPLMRHDPFEWSLVE